MTFGVKLFGLNLRNFIRLFTLFSVLLISLISVKAPLRPSTATKWRQPKEYREAPQYPKGRE